MKNPIEGSKASLPGGLAVKEVDGVPVVFPQEMGLVTEAEDLLQTVYDHGPCQGRDLMSFAPVVMKSSVWRRCISAQLQCVQNAHWRYGQ